MNTLQIKNLSFKYPRHHLILRNLNATFRPGTISLITGPSGTGKSTLLKSMARLLPIQHGMVYYGRQLLTRIPSRQLSNYVAMMFQDPNRQFAMRTVKHELIFTLENRTTPIHQIATLIDQILVDNHLMPFKNRKLATLSGGEKQRVALAIITALNSRVILLDEPFANVDLNSRRKIMQRLVQLKRTGKIIVIVDHDLRGYSKITDQLLVMKARQLHPATFKQFTYQVHDLKHSWRLPTPVDNQLYRIRDFHVGYRAPLINVDHFNFYQHRATLITGPNGSGKSTLFRVLLKLIRYHGQVTYNGRPLSQFKAQAYYRHVNLVFQEPTDQFLEITVEQELELSIHALIHPSPVKKRLRTWLKFTGLDQHLGQVVYSLSGGQQRALQLIEVLISNAPVMLMDEPFQSLDPRLINFFKTLLKEAVRKYRRTLIVISHQVAPVADLFDYHVELKAGRLHYLRGLEK